MGYAVFDPDIDVGVTFLVTYNCSHNQPCRGACRSRFILASLLGLQDRLNLAVAKLIDDLVGDSPRERASVRRIGECFERLDGNARCLVFAVTRRPERRTSGNQDEKHNRGYKTAEPNTALG